MTQHLWWSSSSSASSQHHPSSSLSSFSIRKKKHQTFTPRSQSLNEAAGCFGDLWQCLIYLLCMFVLCSFNFIVPKFKVPLLADCLSAGSVRDRGGWLQSLAAAVAAAGCVYLPSQSRAGTNNWVPSFSCVVPWFSFKPELKIVQTTCNLFEGYIFIRRDQRPSLMKK